MNDSIKNIESTPTIIYDKKDNGLVTADSAMAFAKEANYIKNASDIEFIGENGYATDYAEDETYYDGSIDLTF